jgi:hypothetical protein
MDPAAVGTTRIGLDKIRHDDDLYQRAVPRNERSRRRLDFIRRRVADTLRRTAERVAPSPATA